LDIVGDDITNDALTDDIVLDLRRRVVDSVCVLRKRIITESHKRPAG